MIKILLWGTGYIANKILHDYKIFDEYDVIGFIDNDTCKQGKKIFEKDIYAPEILLTVKVDKIIILTDKYEEIKQQIINDLEIEDIIIEDWRYFQTQLRILKRYKDTTDLEAKNILNHIVQNGLEIFNYTFDEKYKNMNVSVLYDQNCKMFYVMHQGKKMYFARSFDTADSVADYYKSLLLEQDEKSPHRYLDESFTVHSGDIVLDAGVAEGNFALEIIEQVSKLYLIETDDGWVEALKETFKDYHDKVVILQKYLTSMDDGNYATLDCLISEPVNFIKMDIEGNEWDALLGAEKLINRSPKLQCAICSYHAEYDETLIRSLLTQYGLRCNVTKGYMWYPSAGRDGNMSTKLCRGIVRGIK